MPLFPSAPGRSKSGRGYSTSSTINPRGSDLYGKYYNQPSSQRYATTAITPPTVLPPPRLQPGPDPRRSVPTRAGVQGAIPSPWPESPVVESGSGGHLVPPIDSAAFWSDIGIHPDDVGFRDWVYNASPRLVNVVMNQLIREGYDYKALLPKYFADTQSDTRDIFQKTGKNRLAGPDLATRRQAYNSPGSLVWSPSMGRWVQAYQDPRAVKNMLSPNRNPFFGERWAPGLFEGQEREGFRLLLNEFGGSEASHQALESLYPQLLETFQGHIADDPNADWMEFLSNVDITQLLGDLAPFQRGENPGRYIGRGRNVLF